MEGGIRLFFAFLSLIVVAYLVIYLVNKGQNTAQVSQSVFSGFTGLIGTLGRAQAAGNPGGLYS